ncbi:MAG: sugar ABC transporter permease [Oscillospiraceae bacterium]
MKTSRAIQSSSNMFHANKRKTTLAAYLFLLPTILLFGLFFYFPAISSFFYSLNDYHVISPAVWVGLENYKNILSDRTFWQSLFNTFCYFIIIVPSLVILPLLLAILVNQKLKGMYFFRLLYYLPYITSMVAVAIVWKYLYHPEGLINNIFQMLGAYKNSPAINWLFNPKTALLSIAVLEVWKAAGYYMIIYLAALQSVPAELVESAKMDGACNRHIFRYIIVPCLRPTITVAIILSSMSAVKIFTSVYVMTGGGPLNATMTLPMYIYNEGFVNLDMGYASALGIILWFLLLILSIFNFKTSAGKEDN